MRVLLLSDSIPPEGKGGAEMVVWRLARGLTGAGHETHVVAATAGEPFEEVRDGIPTYHIRAGYPERFRAWLSLRNPQTGGALRELLRRLQPDVVNAHNIHFLLSYHALRLAREAGCAVVFSAHDALPFAYGKLTHFVRSDFNQMRLPADYRLPRGHNLRQNRFRYNPFRNAAIRRYLSGDAQARTAPSRALAEAWEANELPPAEVVHNGIDPADWVSPGEANVAALRSRLGLDGARVMLFVGRLTREKGVLEVLRVLDRLRTQLPDLRLLVLTARDVDAQIPPAFAHLRPLICGGGWLSGAELRAAYHLADVVATPSIYLDPFPTVNLEAMAAGVPVVATCFGGSSELVLDGETGYVVNPFDTAAFADRLLRLLRDEALRRELGVGGRRRIAEKFSLERQVTRMLDVYERAAR